MMICDSCKRDVCDWKFAIEIRTRDLISMHRKAFHFCSFYCLDEFKKKYKELSLYEMV